MKPCFIKFGEVYSNDLVMELFLKKAGKRVPIKTWLILKCLYRGIKLLENRHLLISSISTNSKGALMTNLRTSHKTVNFVKCITSLLESNKVCR